MGDLNSIFNGAHDALDQIEGSGITNSLNGIFGGNVMLDPAPEMSRTIADVFAAIVEVFSILRNLMKV